MRRRRLRLENRLDPVGVGATPIRSFCSAPGRKGARSVMLYENRFVFGTSSLDVHARFRPLGRWCETCPTLVISRTSSPLYAEVRLRFDVPIGDVVQHDLCADQFGICGCLTRGGNVTTSANWSLAAVQVMSPWPERISTPTWRRSNTASASFRATPRQRRTSPHPQDAIATSCDRSRLGGWCRPQPPQWLVLVAPAERSWG